MDGMKDRVFILLIILFLLASFAPAVYELNHRNTLPPIHQFELVHNFPTDFNFYLSRIRQGIEGNMTVREQYTSEPHQGSFIHVFYLFLGWLGRWVRVPWNRSADVYHVARIVFGGLLLVMIAEFCKKSFSDKHSDGSFFGDGAVRGSLFAAHPSNPSVSSPSIRSAKDMTVLKKTLRAAPFLFPLDFSLITHNASLLAFLLAVTASTWPKLVFYNGGWRFGGYMPWWSVMDSLQRITFIPHLLVGQALTLFLIMAISDEATMKRPGNWVFLGVLAFLLGVIFPPGLVFVIATVGVLIMLEWLFEAKGINFIAAAKKLIPTKLIPRAIVLGLGIPSLVYLSLMTSFYPWKRLAEFDIVKPLPFDYGEYFLAVGPILVLGILGFIVAFSRRERRMLPSMAWIFAWGVLLFVFQFIPSQSPLRFSEMIPHVPLGMLTAYLFYILVGTLRQGTGDKRQADYAGKNFLLVSYLMFLVTLILSGLGVMYSSYLWQRDFVDHKIRAGLPLVPTGSYVLYPLKDFISAMTYIQDATSRDTVILAETTAGNYIPVESGNTVYVGHANTVHAEEKELVVRQFFSGRMSAEQARAWLRRENLHWIFFGPQEREDGGISDLARTYSFLRAVYKNAFVTVYQTK